MDVDVEEEYAKVGVAVIAAKLDHGLGWLPNL
jgi:hypothetical protein